MPVQTNPSVRPHVCIMRCGSITLKRAVRQRTEDGLGMEDLQTLAGTCNTLIISRKEIRSAVRVRSSALTIWSSSRDRGGLSSVRQARDLAVAEGVDEQSVIVAEDLGVAAAELHHLLDELLFVAAQRLDDLILSLKADECRVGVLVCDTVDLGGRPTEIF